jgi:hypothetical protein
MSVKEMALPETDPRFPSGKWTGFFVQKHLRPGQHAMELHLRFLNGVIGGEGRDLVGEFTIRGRYELADGTCYWNKRYVNAHDVFYKGYNESKGIWGLWEIATDGLRGGFRIWPEGMSDPTKPTLHEELDEPTPLYEDAEIGLPVLVPAIRG